MPKNAAFYVADPSMIGSYLFDTIENLESYSGLTENDLASGFILYLPWGQIQMNIMPETQIPAHLRGFEGYIRSQLKDKDDLTYLLGRLHHVKLCLGCQITHSEETEEDVVQFLFEFNNRLNSLLFLYNSVWDWTGMALCGPHRDGS